MADSSDQPVLILCDPTELNQSDAVWGTGGWIRPEAREALDWVTLTRLLGWGASVCPARPGFETAIGPSCRYIIVACQPGVLHQEVTRGLEEFLRRERCLIIARACHAASGGALFGAALGPGRSVGTHLEWVGPGSPRGWKCGTAVEVGRLASPIGEQPWAVLDGEPVIVAGRRHRGTAVTLAFHPSQARDADGAFSALLKELLVRAREEPAAWIDWRNTMVLRMDDPGGSQNLHNRAWSYRKLTEEKWFAIGADLKRRNACLSIAYVSGWVDDGDGTRGSPTVDGASPSRRPGGVFPSPLVTYRSESWIDDYTSEFRGIQALRSAGLADVEMHGHTHMHPDSESWARAADRYENLSWYRELGPAARPTISRRGEGQHPIALGITLLKRYFGVFPTTLICPGDEWTNEVLEEAGRLGLRLIDSYYLALRVGRHFCWNYHVCAPYLDEADPRWFRAELPVVGYFHDYEVSVHGTEWMTRALNDWEAAGCGRFIDFRAMAAAIERRVTVAHGRGGFRVVVDSEDGPALVRPLKICIRVPGGLPRTVSLMSDGRSFTSHVTRIDDEMGEVEVPVSIDR